MAPGLHDKVEKRARGRGSGVGALQPKGWTPTLGSSFLAARTVVLRGRWPWARKEARGTSSAVTVVRSFLAGAVDAVMV